MTEAKLLHIVGALEFIFKNNDLMAKNLKALGVKIKKQRKMRGLTQVELAVIVSVSTGYIGSIEQGLRYPSLRLLEKLARALKVPLKELL